jgi:hypothetical protein
VEALVLVDQLHQEHLLLLVEQAPLVKELMVVEIMQTGVLVVAVEQELQDLMDQVVMLVEAVMELIQVPVDLELQIQVEAEVVIMPALEMVGQAEVV